MFITFHVRLTLARISMMVSVLTKRERRLPREVLSLPYNNDLVVNKGVEVLISIAEAPASVDFIRRLGLTYRAYKAKDPKWVRLIVAPTSNDLKAYLLGGE
jgi:hypothetical protein